MMQSDIVQEEFNRKAAIYESYRLADWYKAHAQEIARWLPANVDGDILDIGCATGFQLRQLADKHPHARLVGIDLAPAMIEQAKHRIRDAKPRNSQQFYFAADNWECLSTQTQHWLKQFDFKVVICANTLHYFLNPQAAIKSMYDILDTDAMVLILEREKSASLLTGLWGMLHQYLIKDQVKFYRAQEICGLMEKVGFSNPNAISIIKKYVWKGKLITSVALIKGEK